VSSLKRFIPVEASSFFLFGPRGTGKTTWLSENFPDSLYIDLLDDVVYRGFLTHPERLVEYIDAAGHTQTVIIDEIQRVPAMLSVVHQQMELHKDLRFILTGSSARKLKRAGVDLLGGRALLKKCFPFMAGYITLYLKEEVQQEGLVRSIDNFSRFMESISFSHGHVLNISDVAREAEVSRKTVEGYIQILHDLLLSYELPVFTKRAKRTLIKHTKFYFFDAGVYMTLRPQGPLDKPEEIAGAALEGLFLQHLQAWVHYGNRDAKIFFWRTKSGTEVDFVLYGRDDFAAFEIKNTTRIRNKDLNGLKSFGTDYPEARLIFLYRGSEKRKVDGIRCLPVAEFLSRLIPGQGLMDGCG
jgi:predicted AAA+ superfamily ATPase